MLLLPGKKYENTTQHGLYFHTWFVLECVLIARYKVKKKKSTSTNIECSKTSSDIHNTVENEFLILNRVQTYHSASML